MKKILIISRKATNCGIADYGKRVFYIIKKSKLYDFYLVEIETEEEYNTAFDSIFPDAVLYNYYPVILPFITDEFLINKRHIPHLIIYHELWTNFTPDGIFDVDSTKSENPELNHFTLPRPLFETFDNKDLFQNEIPTIGSFGFGFPDKNFSRIAELVCEQFDKAKIRLNIPFAEFGDQDGLKAKEEVNKVKNIINNSEKNIQLEVSHDFLNHEDILNFLHQNDINLFLYDPHETRSLSSTIDYALSVKKPIGISKSWMFRHINKVSPSIIVDETPIPEIITNGIKPLQPLYNNYSNKNLLNKIESSITKILNK